MNQEQPAFVVESRCNMAGDGADLRRVQEILEEAAADERRADEVRGQAGILRPEALDAIEPAMDLDALVASDDAQPAIEAVPPAPVGVPRRLRGKTRPPPEWVAYAPAAAPMPSPETPAMKRPARKTWPNEKCPGMENERPCVFAYQQTQMGQASQVDKGQSHCLWCSPARLAAAAEAPQRRKHLTRALRAWAEAGRQDIQDLALARLSEDMRALLEQALQRPSRAAPAVAARREAAAAANAWDGLLAHRQALGPAATEEEKAKYERGRADDKRRVRSKFGPVVEAAEAGDDSRRSARAVAFEAWCRKASWAMCERCHRLEKKPLHETHITGQPTQKHSTAQCSHCKQLVGYPTVAPEHIPAELQKMPEEVIWALRPLEPDVGRPVRARHGYRVHADMIRFWWRPQKVADQVEALADPAHKAQAAEAYAFWWARPILPMAASCRCTQPFCDDIGRCSLVTHGTESCNYLGELWKRKA